MTAPKTPALSEEKAGPDEEFLAWLDETDTPALIAPRHERYYAYCMEFGIAGSGRTEEEAVQDAVDLLIRYLIASFSEGRAYRDSKKPPPVHIRLRWWYLTIRGRFLRRVKPSLSRLGGLISVPTTDRDARRLAH